MKNFFKAVIICVALSMLLTSCSAQQDSTISDKTGSSVNTENPDFRKVKWGMSKDEVIAIEGEPTKEITYPEKYCLGLLYDDVPVIDYTAQLNYYLENDMLIKATYRFNCDDKTDLQINTMYYDLHNEYIKKYGTPTISSFVMQNTNYTNLTAPPHILDSDFSFGNTAAYTDEWSNVNGASISISLTYSAIEGTNKLVIFTVTYKAINNDI